VVSKESERRRQSKFWQADARRGGKARDLAGVHAGKEEADARSGKEAGAHEKRRKQARRKDKEQARELLPPLSALLCSLSGCLFVSSAPCLAVSLSPLLLCSRLLCNSASPRKRLENA
jgi:hypothetical protein